MYPENVSCTYANMYYVKNNGQFGLGYTGWNQLDLLLFVVGSSVTLRDECRLKENTWTNSQARQEGIVGTFWVRLSRG